ncbi:MAG: sensor histidine kinase [Anaerolineales bacterium]|jgi:signal transduction histidine kinase
MNDLHPPRINPRWQPVVNAAWVGTAMVVLSIFLFSIPAYRTALENQHFLAGKVEDPAPLIQVINITGGVVSFGAAFLSLVLAAVIFVKWSNDLMAMFVSFYILVYGVLMAGPVEVLGLVRYESFKHIEALLSVLFIVPTIALICIFPSGRFIPRWTRWLVIVSLPLSPTLLVYSTQENILGNSLLKWAISVAWLIILGASLYGMVYRYRRISSTEQKQQTKWLVYGLLSMIIMMLILTIPWVWRLNQPAGTEFPLWAHLSSTIWFLSMAILPVSLAISVNHSITWDIDKVFNRTIVYGALTGITMLIYIFIVGYIGGMLQAGNRSFIAFLAAGFVAVIFQPLREILQRVVNRLMYGERDEPYTVLTRLSQKLETVVAPEEVLPAIVETIANALKLPYVGIEVTADGGYRTAASYGLPDREGKSGFKRLALVYKDEAVGNLVLQRRARELEFTQSELKTMTDIARHVGVAVHAVQLNQELRLSQQRLVTAREEERRRLRRDLHDELGPQLASMTLKLDAAGSLVETNPERAKMLLSELKDQTRLALDDIRRIAYNLRPPALDEMGLVPALQEHFDTRNVAQATRVVIQAPEQMPHLPAAVEVAAYRIAMETISNCLQHASANTCTLQISAGEDLRLEISDDGVGLQANQTAGIGLTSMRERARELGGTFKLLSRPEKGTKIEVTLPLDMSELSTLKHYD